LHIFIIEKIINRIIQKRHRI